MNKKDTKNQHFTGEEIDVLEKDGIIYLTMTDESSEEAIEKVIAKTKEELKRLKGKGKIFVHINPVLGLPLRQYAFRNKLVESAKEIIRDIGFSKAAVFGQRTVTRTVAFFIIKAVGIKNIKIFSNKEEALKWLKEP